MDSIAKHFYKEPQREFHIRELAKITKKSPSTVAKYLQKWAKEGLLKEKKQYNHKIYRANTESEIFKEKKRHNNLLNIRKSNLIEHLNKTYNHPEAIILFGSYAKAENTQRSDIDLLIITEKKNKEDLKKFEKKLEHNIQVFTKTKKEIEKTKKENKELLNNWVNGITLSGHWELFE